MRRESRLSSAGARSCMASRLRPLADTTTHFSTATSSTAAGRTAAPCVAIASAAMWPTLNVIRDIYSQAAKATTVLTYIMLWDAYTAFRPAAYARVAFQVAT